MSVVGKAFPLPPVIYRRPPQKGDFEGRLIRRVQMVGRGVLRLWFRDGGAFALQAVVSEKFGVPVIELWEGCFQTGELVPHPCAGYPPAQRKIFEKIADGGIAPCKRRTLDRLLGDGLIVRIGKRHIGKDAFGDHWVDGYEVPPAILAQWLAWCAQKIRNGH